MTEHRPLNTSPLPLRLRVEDYLLLEEGGAFEGYAKTELIEGTIFYMNAQHRAHARTKSRLYRILADALDRQGGGLEAIVEASIAISPETMPEPDIVVTCAPEGEGFIPLYSVALVVEVADSTLDGDLGSKAALYARAKIAEYWVIDVNARVIHQLWSPCDGAYAERRPIPFGHAIAAVTIEGLAVATSTL